MNATNDMVLGIPEKNKWYISGFIASPITFIFPGDSPLWLFSVAIPSVLFTIGFLKWAWPTLTYFLQSAAAKTAFGALNVVLITLSTIHSRNVVSQTLGLPAMNFDLTVKIILSLTYPLMVLVIVVIFCLVVACLIAMNCVPLFEGSKVTHHRKVKTVWFYLNAFGALATGILAFGAITAMTTLPGAVSETIKTVAYWSDYQEANDYPGIIKGRRYRLLENGVVTYADKDNGQTVITVTNIEAPAERCAHNGGTR